jgi:hypothetical protein
VLYRPPQLDSSVQRAVRFPLAATDYGSALYLLSNISQLSSQHFGLAEESSTITGLWAASTWVPEFFAAPPTLCVAGCSTAEMMKFVRFFAAICRRAISVADLSPRLPLAIGPTLLVVGSGSPKKVLGTWRACSYHDVYIPAGRDRLQQLVCPKAIFSENADAISSWAPEALRVVLLPGNELASLTESDLEAIAAELQPKLQLFRLRSLQSKSVSGNRRCPAEVACSELGREFFSLLAGEPGIPQLLLPMVEQQRQSTAARRLLDPLALVVEVIWMPAHEENQITTSEVRQRVNALLLTRGERLEYSANEIGWKLSDLGLRRHRNSKGMVLKFSREVRKRMHGLAGQFGLKLRKVDGCEDCAPVQVIQQ